MDLKINIFSSSKLCLYLPFISKNNSDEENLKLHVLGLQKMDKIDFRHVSLHFYFLKTLTLTLKLGRRRQPFWENMNLHVCSVKDMLLLLKCVPYEQRSSQSTVAYCRAMCHWPGRYEGSQVRLACHYGSIQGCIFGTHLRYVLNASIQQQQY